MCELDHCHRKRRYFSKVSFNYIFRYLSDKRFNVSQIRSICYECATICSPWYVTLICMYGYDSMNVWKMETSVSNIKRVIKTRTLRKMHYFLRHWFNKSARSCEAAGTFLSSYFSWNQWFLIKFNLSILNFLFKL